MIRVGVNLTWLRPGAVGGSENYLTRVLRGIAEIDPSDLELVLFVLPEFAKAHPDLAESFETYVAPISGSRRPVRVAIESTWLPLRARRSKITILHHAGGTVPLLRGTPAMVTVHDLQYLDMAENFGRAKLRYLRIMVPLAVRAARLVMLPSDYSRQRVLEAFGVDGVVVPHGIDALQTDAHAPQFAKDFVIYPAMTHPHKNHDLLLRMLLELDDVHLVLTGGKGAAHDQVLAKINELGLQDRVHHLGVVSMASLGALYGEAQALVFPSLYEGFGAPPVEAMLAGCPVLSSNATCSPEVVGTGGVLLDPNDAQAWANAVSEIISDPQRRQALVDAGKVQAQKFSPENAAEAQLAAYRQAVTGLAKTTG